MSIVAHAQAELGRRVSAVMASPLVEDLAVLATFDPDREVPDDQREAVQQISDQLADRDGRRQWMLKEGIRVEALARVLGRSGTRKDSEVGDGEQRPGDTVLQRMLDKTLRRDEINLDELDEDELLALLHVRRWCAAAGSRAEVPGFASELDREGIEGRLALIETLRPLREITRDGCLGRDAELQTLREYVGGPPDQTLLDRPPLLVYGVGGVGKSTLTAQFLLELAERAEPTAWAYLDLDRPTLASYEPLPLLNDVIRQVGAQFPEMRRFLDYSAYEATEKALGSGVDDESDSGVREAVRRLARAVYGACEGRLVVVLDTFEELQRAEVVARRSGASTPLYGMFLALSRAARSFRLVVSGRAPALTFVSSQAERTDEWLRVGPFEGDAAEQVLQHLYDKELERVADESTPSLRGGIDAELAEQVVDTVGGSPLSLKLAARVLAMEGEVGLADAEARAGAIGRVTEEFVRGFLYHRILGHIKGGHREDREVLQRVAAASLGLRQVTTDLLSQVILPAIGRPNLDPDSMLTGLMAETALTDRQGGTIRLRDELRGPALLALSYDDPELVAEVHQRAADYYAQHDELPGASVELAYHRLAMGESDALDGLDMATISALQLSAAGLPSRTRELMADAAAGAPTVREALRREAREREAEGAAQQALDAGDLDAAERALVPEQERLPTTRLYRLDAQIAEARGDLSAAVVATRRDVSAALAAEEPQSYCAAAIRLALLMERTSDPSVAVAELTQADSRPWLAGHILLRLELQLNRLAVIERSPAMPADRWVLELDARALLQKADPTLVRSTTALVRLLAATLGKDEPGWVLDAVRSLGLGTSTYSSHIRNLSEALGAWDFDRPEPGSVARSVGLPTDERPTLESLTSGWFSAVAGQALDTVPLLDRAFSSERPSPVVVEALRMIYLWWGMDPQWNLEEHFGGEPPPHFLDGPIDYGDDGSQRLLRLLTGAYPHATDLQVLAAQVGLDASTLPSKATRGLSTQRLLDEASRAGRMPDLIRQVLADPKTRSFHDDVRNLVGSDWLTRHGIEG